VTGVYLPHVSNVRDPTGQLKPFFTFGKLRTARRCFAFPSANSNSFDGRLLAVADASALRIWDLAAGREVWRKPDAVRSVLSLAFAPDGRTLAAACDDTTILVWLVPQVEKGQPIAVSERDSLWADLASEDPPKGHAALWRLIDDPATAVPILRDRLLPAPTAAEKVQPLVRDLASDDFKTREAAERRLRGLGREALPTLRAALKNEQRPEAKRRLETLVTAFGSADERRRNARATAVLERIGNSEARHLLEKLTSLPLP